MSTAKAMETLTIWPWKHSRFGVLVSVSSHAGRGDRVNLDQLLAHNQPPNVSSRVLELPLLYWALSDPPIFHRPFGHELRVSPSRAS